MCNILHVLHNMQYIAYFSIYCTYVAENYQPYKPYKPIYLLNTSSKQLLSLRESADPALKRSPRWKGRDKPTYKQTGR